MSGEWMFMVLRSSISSWLIGYKMVLADLVPDSLRANLVGFFFDIVVLMFRFSSCSFINKSSQPLAVIPGFYFSNVFINDAEPLLPLPNETLSEHIDTFFCIRVFLAPN